LTVIAMKKPVPYDNKRVFKKSRISQEEYDKILTEASIAKQVLSDDKFQFIRDILLSAQEYAQTSIIENTVMEVSDEVTISERIKKIFTQTKKVQVDELSGQYKLVKKFFRELEEYIKTRDDIRTQVADDKVIIDG